MSPLKRKRLMKLIAEKAKKEKSLTIMVGCRAIGKIKMRANGYITIVDYNNIMPKGNYLMSLEQVESIIHNKVYRDYKGKSISIVYS